MRPDGAKPLAMEMVKTAPSKLSPVWCLPRLQYQSQYEETICGRINNITMSISGSVYVPLVGVWGGGGS